MFQGASVSSSFKTRLEKSCTAIAPEEIDKQFSGTKTQHSWSTSGTEDEISKRQRQRQSSNSLGEANSSRMETIPETKTKSLWKLSSIFVRR